MPEHVSTIEGRLKLYLYGQTTLAVYYKEQELASKPIEVFVKSFFTKKKMFALIFDFLSIEHKIQFFMEENYDDNRRNINNQQFKFPRLKKVKEDGTFIFSMIFQNDTKAWLVVGKFEGDIPDGCKYYEDELTYEHF